MPIVLAGRRSATAALAQMCVYDLNLGIDLRGSSQIPSATAGQSCAAMSSTNAFNGVDFHHPLHLPRPNPHSARGTTACHFPRFPSLEAFGRRPQASVVAATSVTGRHPKPFTRADISRCTNRHRRYWSGQYRHRTAETFGQILSWLLETVRLRSAPELAVGARAEN
jgi:hypothetical protein